VLFRSVLSKLVMSLFALISELAPGYRPGRDILVGIRRIRLDGSPVSMTIKLPTIKQNIIISTVATSCQSCQFILLTM
jgi:hypothetical protein